MILACLRSIVEPLLSSLYISRVTPYTALNSRLQGVDNVNLVRIYRDTNKHKHTLVVIEKEDGSEQEFTAGRHTSDKRIYELARVITPRKKRKG